MNDSPLAKSVANSCLFKMLETDEIASDRLFKTSKSLQLCVPTSLSESDLRSLKSLPHMPSARVQKNSRAPRVKLNKKFHEFEMALMVHEFHTSDLNEKTSSAPSRPGTPAPFRDKSRTLS